MECNREIILGEAELTQVEVLLHRLTEAEIAQVEVGGAQLGLRLARDALGGRRLAAVWQHLGNNFCDVGGRGFLAPRFAVCRDRQP